MIPNETEGIDNALRFGGLAVDENRRGPRFAEDWIASDETSRAGDSEEDGRISGGGDRTISILHVRTAKDSIFAAGSERAAGQVKAQLHLGGSAGGAHFSHRRLAAANEPDGAECS